MRNRFIHRAVHRAMDLKDAGPGPGQTAAEIKALEDLKTLFLDNHKQLKLAVESANAEAKTAGSVSVETKQALIALTETLNGVGLRLDKVEAKDNRQGEPAEDQKSIGRLFIDAPDYKLMGQEGGMKLTKCRLETTKQIVNATGQNQPLVPQLQLPGVQQQPNRRLRIRDLLPVGRTVSNLVQYAKENVFTNNAGPQAGASPTVAGEGVLKNESDITFTLANAPVVTIAHFIVASRQVLDDAPMLESYINNRLLYGLALEEEDELLNGDGTVGQLDGLMHQATAYNRAETGTKIDWVRRAMTQLQLSEYDAEFIILNPVDWESIELTKDAQNRYIIANPITTLSPRLWGLPVVPTNSMTAGNFLVGNGNMACQIWDRMQAAVELSREDSDNFRRNLVTILAEERLAFTVYRPQALIKGVFSV